MALAEVGQCDGLRFLSISNCPQLSTEGFRSVVDGCRGLRTVLCALHVLNKPRGLRQVLVDDALLGRAWEAWPQLSRFATTQQAFSLAGFANVAASLHNLSLEDCPVDDEVCVVRRCNMGRLPILSYDLAHDPQLELPTHPIQRLISW